MDCIQAEINMMKHFDKNISPENAKKLVEHVLVCQNCRELYLTFDESFDLADEPLEAPEGFTQNVMAMVRKEAAYSKPYAEEAIGGRQVVLRVLWGLSAVVLGVGIFFIYNPDWLAALANSYPFVAGVLDWLASVGSAFSAASEWLSQNAVTVAAESLSVLALLFVMVMGILLYVLHNSDREKSVKT